MNNQRIFKIHPQDNVAVALQPIQAGEVIKVAHHEVIVREGIPKGHKVALQKIEKNQDIIKYGFPIGHAQQTIESGQHVHTHNTRTNLDGLLEYSYQYTGKAAADQSFSGTFQGYVRCNGDVGIRNEIWIVHTVGCVNKVGEALARQANQAFAERNFDGVNAFTHPYGCSQLGDDLLYTQKTLAGLVHHPNAGGVLVLGLGCENNHIEAFKSILGPYDPQRVRFLNSQDVEDEMIEGMKVLEELVDYVEGFNPQPIPISKLKVGLKCGGSDAFSGITANPLVGAFSDLLVSRGGTTVLTEVPEMFGAETLFMNRCISEEVFKKNVDMINDFKRYFMNYGQVIYENPSPGNKEGGITTLEEKSLGCTQKGGASAVVDVLDYGDQVGQSGLNLLNGPGNDMVAVTALTAAGVHLILFTTGRGTPLGAPVPTVKISTNTELSLRKPGWIDFNAGVLLEGKEMEEVKETFFDYILEVASGRIKTRNEEKGFREIAIFKDGVTE